MKNSKTTQFDQGIIKKKLSCISKIRQEGDNIISDIMRVNLDTIPQDEYKNHWKNFANDGRKNNGYDPAIVYIHFPFCTATCFCCKFTTQHFNRKVEIERYLKCLNSEIQIWSDVLSSINIHAFHIGGGSPSLLSESQLEELLGNLSTSFRQADPFYFCVEMDPHTTTLGKTKILKKYGVKRVSFGVQSFSKRVLKAINRSYQTPKRIKDAVAFCREAEIDIINFDIMAGLPEDTEETFSETILESVKLFPDSIYVYRFINWNSPLYHCGYSVSSEDTRRGDRMMVLAEKLIRKERPPLVPELERMKPSYGCQFLWKESPYIRNVYDDLRMNTASHLALGFGAMSHIHNKLFALCSGDLEDYCRSLEMSNLPDYMINNVSQQFDMSFYASNRINVEVLSPNNFQQIFNRPLDKIFNLELDYLLSIGAIEKVKNGYAKNENISLSENDILCAIFFSIDELERTVDTLKRLVNQRRLQEHPCALVSKGGVVQLDNDASGSTINSIDCGKNITQHTCVNIWDNGEINDRRFLDEIEKAKCDHAKDIVVWSDGRRFESTSTALASLSAGLSSVVITVCGSDAILHDSITGIDGSFSQTFRGITNFIDLNLESVKVHIPVERSNQDDILPILKKLSNIGIAEFIIDFKESIPQRLSSQILQIALSKKLYIETFNRFRRSPFEQFNTTHLEPCVPLFHCLHYLSSVPSYKIVYPISS